MTLGFKFKFYYNVLKNRPAIVTYPITMGGGFLLNNLKIAYIRKLELHFFNIIVVKICPKDFILMHRVGCRTIKRWVGVSKKYKLLITLFIN